MIPTLLESGILAFLFFKVTSFGDQNSDDWISKKKITKFALKCGIVEMKNCIK